MSGLISRRRLLRGAGALLALPLLEAMAPPSTFREVRGSTQPPRRMAFLYVPNGVHMADWTPVNEGPNFALSPILAPLEQHRDDLLVLTGLTADKARAHGDGGGDHARAMAAFLTGCQPRKTEGTDLCAGISVDQVAATNLGNQTRLPSLEIGAEEGRLAGGCDTGYSCAYSNALSWRSPTTPLPKIVNPRQVFQRLFSTEPDAGQARRERTRRSILDHVLEDAADLRDDLGAEDRRKLDEYFTAVRDVERRLETASRRPPVRTPNFTIPATYDYAEHLRLLCDLLVLAFQTDTTRICTFVFANEGSNKAYPYLGVPEAHHQLSHHQNDPAKQAKIAAINRFHVTQFAYLLTRLKSVPEGDGTLLDHSMIVYGSGNSDGNRHNHDDLPILLAGKAGNSLRTGRHLRYHRETPLNNLWLALLDRMGTSIDALGDSTGRLAGLNG